MQFNSSPPPAQPEPYVADFLIYWFDENNSKVFLFAKGAGKDEGALISAKLHDVPYDDVAFDDERDFAEGA